MDKEKEIRKLKAHDADKEKRLASIEAQLGKAAQSAATPGGSFEVTHPCNHKQVYTGMPGASAEALEKAKADYEAQDCPGCITKAAQQERKRIGKAEFEGREVDGKAMVTRR